MKFEPPLPHHFTYKRGRGREGGRESENMLGSLLGRKFSNKCKHSVKCIKCRMETIRKKKQAIVRYLKKDVADLVSGGHEFNAFGRMDALIVEINQSSCYDMIEQYCCCILEHLTTMQKERVCPEETVEAIATLIFAAARFSDLPELAVLRREFAHRYGTHMEAYINEEFADKMQKKSFTKDKKLQLMQDIAHEFSISWDVKAFEYNISNPSTKAFEGLGSIGIELQSCTNLDEYSHSTTSDVVKEMNHNNRAFNLKPPYVKPKVTANYNMSNGGDRLTRGEEEGTGNCH